LNRPGGRGREGQKTLVLPRRTSKGHSVKGLKDLVPLRTPGVKKGDSRTKKDRAGMSFVPEGDARTSRLMDHFDDGPTWEGGKNSYFTVRAEGGKKALDPPRRRGKEETPTKKNDYYAEHREPSLGGHSKARRRRNILSRCHERKRGGKDTPSIPSARGRGRCDHPTERGKSFISFHVRTRWALPKRA